VNMERDHALTTGSILWVIIPLCDRCHLLGNLQTVELPMRIARHRFTSVAGAIEAAAKILSAPEPKANGAPKSAGNASAFVGLMYQPMLG
jgi:hypothetical protein